MRRSLVTNGSNSLCIISGPTFGNFCLWLARNNDQHGGEKDENERKRLEKLQPQVLTLYSKVDLLLAYDKPIFELPIQEQVKLHRQKLETWAQLVTPSSIKRALADAAQYLLNTNHTITAFLAPARPDPLMTNELVNELRPSVSRLQSKIQLEPNKFLSFSFESHRIFGSSRQLCACRSYGSISGVVPQQGVTRQ